MKKNTKGGNNSKIQNRKTQKESEVFDLESFHFDTFARDWDMPTI